MAHVSQFVQALYTFNSRSIASALLSFTFIVCQYSGAMPSAALLSAFCSFVRPSITNRCWVKRTQTLNITSHSRASRGCGLWRQSE